MTSWSDGTIGRKMLHVSKISAAKPESVGSPYRARVGREAAGRPFQREDTAKPCWCISTSGRLFTDVEFPPSSAAFNTRLPDGDIRQSLPIRWRTRSLPRPDNQLATRNPPVRAAYRIACQSRRLARQGVSLSTRSTCAANH